MNRPLLILFAILFTVANAVTAQTRITFEPFLGEGISHIRKSTQTADFSPRMLPRAGVSVHIPIEGGCAIRTGAGYQQMGWRSFSAFNDTDDYRFEVRKAERLHVLAIPLQLAYTFSRKSSLRYEFAGGMSYWFFVQADEHVEAGSYRGGRLLSGDAIDYHPYIALIPDDSRLKSTYDGTAYYRFNPAMRLDASVVWRSRWRVQAFWEYGLNGLSAVAGNTAALHLGAAGLIAGIML